MNHFKPQSFSILPNVIKNLIIVNSLMFVAKMIFGSVGERFFNQYLALHSLKSEHFKIYQLITHLFVHGDFSHLFYNMFALWMFGSILEHLFGDKKFMTFYLICGVGAAICHLLVMLWEQGSLIEILNSSEMQMLNTIDQSRVYDAIMNKINIPMVGASGAVFGCLAAFGYMFPNNYIYIYFLIPIKTKWFITAYIGIEIFYTIMETNGINNGGGIARFAHLGGALFGFLMVFINKKYRRRLF